jgi:hypothetical protein
MRICGPSAARAGPTPPLFIVCILCLETKKSNFRIPRSTIDGLLEEYLHIDCTIEGTVNGKVSCLYGQFSTQNHNGSFTLIFVLFCASIVKIEKQLRQDQQQAAQCFPEQLQKRQKVEHQILEHDQVQIVEVLYRQEHQADQVSPDERVILITRAFRSLKFFIAKNIKRTKFLLTNV